MNPSIEHQVITTVGVDRPGLVNELSELILDVGANVEDSRMVALGGSFACMVLVGGPATAHRALRERLPAFAEAKGLTTSCVATTPAPGRLPGASYHLAVSGLDHRGIVHHVASALAQLEVNVDTLHTRLVPAPMSGAPTFEMVAEITAPPSLDGVVLRRRLEEVCEDENLDLTLTPSA